MNQITQIKQNTQTSFGLVKEDVIKLFRALRELEEKVSRQENELVHLYNEISSLKVSLVKPVKAITFAASKEGQKVHRTDCVFAKNIKPKNKISFETKNLALESGYDLCACVSA